MNTEYYIDDFDELRHSQIPALIQLINLGYGYLSKEEIRDMRESNSQYVLREVALEALKRINPDVSEKSILDTLVDFEKVNLSDGLYKASEVIFSDLLSGRGVSEIIKGKKESLHLSFIDFKNPQNNTFSVTAEFNIKDAEKRRLDIVTFVNGFPLAVIECKRSSVRIEEAIYQHLDNQKAISKFYLYPQILIATNCISLKYATMLTPANYFSVWKEEQDPPLESIHTPISQSCINKISSDLLGNTSYTQQKSSVANEQAYGIYSLLRPARILDILRNFIIYDKGVKKITRHQQFFAIKKTLSRLCESPARGGLIWHTQGSGKSLTMLMLVKELCEKFKNPRVFVISDRIDLGDQISDTFAACNIKKKVKVIKSSDMLVKCIKEKSQDILFSLVQKFDRIKDKSFVDADENVYVLIDEAHRTQSGKANTWMNTILPNAKYIAFTGTPLMSKEKEKEKDSAKKFGGIIDAYTIAQAEEDGAILPLVYQAKFIEMQTMPAMLDKFYESITKPFSEQERKDFEKKVLSSKMINENSNRIELIAMDIVEHYKGYFQGTGLKGQVVMPSKYTAVLAKQAIDLIGGVRAELIISTSRDSKEDADNLPEQKKLVADFETSEKLKHGNLKEREKKLIAEFKKEASGVELLIVVDKLLTGFDAPRNTVLYLAKQIKDHNLLQAIARVNRLFDGDENKQKKESGIILDYSKNAENIKNAMDLFSNFDPEDVKNALISTDEKIAELKNLYQRLEDILKNKNADESLNLLKSNDLLRNDFYEDLNDFIKVFSTCLCLSDFSKKIKPLELELYSKALKNFVEIKKTTQLAMAEIVDFSKYKEQLHKILNKYVSATEVENLSKPINLSDVEAFNDFIEDQKNAMSDRSKAEAIAAQTKKIISERYIQDSAFYRKFSDKIDAILFEIKDAKQLDLAILLGKMREAQSQVDNYEDSDIPKEIRSKKAYHPFFRNLKEYIPTEESVLANIVKEIVDIIEKEKRVDWYKNINVERCVKNNIDDFLYEIVIEEMAIDLSDAQVKSIIEEAWNIAVNNKDRL